MSDSRSPVDIFKALADDTRSRIALLIAREGELCVCELTAGLDLSQPKISRHLALLRSNGLLTDRRQGQWVFYRLHPDLSPWVITLLHGALADHQGWLAADVAQEIGQLMRPGTNLVGPLGFAPTAYTGKPSSRSSSGFVEPTPANDRSMFSGFRSSSNFCRRVCSSACFVSTSLNCARRLAAFSCAVF
jgi:ArsR family transcriptional regulator